MSDSDTIIASIANLPRVQKVTQNGKTVWIKRPEQTRRSLFVIIHKALSYFLPTALKPTNATGGMQALIDEADKLKKFSAHSINVPNIIRVNTDHIVLSDTGMSLRKSLKALHKETERMVILEKAAFVLIKAHRANLTHGRPHIKDMTIDESQNIYLLDLEESPEKVMALEDAQARDVWLFISSSAEYFADKPAAIAMLLKLFLNNCSDTNQTALINLGQELKSLRKIISLFGARNISKDVTGAYYATLALEGLST